MIGELKSLKDILNKIFNYFSITMIMLSNVTPIGYVRRSHNKGILAIQNIYIYIYI